MILLLCQYEQKLSDHTGNCEILVHVYFIAFLKYITYILEIEATVYKTFPAEIIDGPASPFFLISRQVHFFLYKKKIETK